MNRIEIITIANILGIFPRVGMIVQIAENISPSPFQKVDHIVWEILILQNYLYTWLQYENTYYTIIHISILMAPSEL